MAILRKQHGIQFTQGDIENLVRLNLTLSKFEHAALELVTHLRKVNVGRGDTVNFMISQAHIRSTCYEKEFPEDTILATKVDPSTPM